MSSEDQEMGLSAAEEANVCKLTINVVEAVGLFHCHDDIIPKVKNKVVKSKAPTKNMKTNVKKKTDSKDGSTADETSVPLLSTSSSIRAWGGFQDSKESLDNTSTSIQHVSPNEAFSGVINDSFDPKFNFEYSIDITQKERFLAVICQQPKLLVTVYEMSIDEKDRKKTNVQKKKKVVTNETENPNDKYNIRTIIGTAEIDVTPFLHTETVVEGWFDINVSASTLEAAKRVAFFHAGIDEDDIDEDSMPPQVIRIHEEFSQLKPRVFVSLNLSEPLATKQEEAESNMFSLQIEQMTNVPYLFMNGLDYQFHSSEFTQTFTLSYQMPLNENEDKTSILTEGILISPEGFESYSAELETQPDTARKKTTRPNSSEKIHKPKKSEDELFEHPSILLTERPCIEWKNVNRHYFTKEAAERFMKNIEEEKHLDIEIKCIRKAIEEKDTSIENNFTIVGRGQINLRSLVKPGKTETQGQTFLSQYVPPTDDDQQDKSARKKAPAKKKKHKPDEIEDMPIETLQQANACLFFHVTTSRPLFKKKKGLELSDLLPEKSSDELVITRNTHSNVPSFKGTEDLQSSLNDIIQCIMKEMTDMENDHSPDRAHHLYARLMKSGSYHNMKEELKPVLISLIRQNYFKHDLENTDTDENVIRRQLLNDLYVKLSDVTSKSINMNTSDVKNSSIERLEFASQQKIDKSKSSITLAISCEASHDNELAHLHFRNAIVECKVNASEISSSLNVQCAYAYREYGAFLLRHGSIALAEGCFKKARELNPDDVTPLILHAALLCNEDRYLEAAQFASQSVEFVPDHPLLISLQGLIHDLAEEDEECLACFQRAQELLTHMHDECQKTMTDIVVVRREDPVVSSLLHSCYESVGNTTVFGLSQSGSPYIYLARFLMLFGLTRACGCLFRVERLHFKALELDDHTYFGSQKAPESSAFYQLLGSIEEARWLGNVEYEEGVEKLEHVIGLLKQNESDKNEQTRMLLLHSYSVLGSIHVKNMPVKAKETFQSYFDLYKTLTDFVGDNVLVFTRNKGEAMKKLPLLDTVACIYLGHIYEQSQNDATDEETKSAELERSRELHSHFCWSNSTNPYAWLGMGLASLRLEKFSEAQRALAKASELDDKNALVWTYLTIVMLRMSVTAKGSDKACQVTEAIQAFQFVLQYNLKDARLFAEIGALFAKEQVYSYAEMAYRRSLILEENPKIQSKLDNVMKQVNKQK